MVTRRMFLRLVAMGGPAMAVLAREADGGIVFARTPRLSWERLAGQVRLYRRAAWAAAGPVTERLRAAKGYRRITVHHEGNGVNAHTSADAVARDLNGILSAHQGQRYGDIGYHFMVDHGGGVWEGRSLAYEGAHVLGENDRNLGVMLLGNFEVQRPSAVQLAAATRLLVMLGREFGISARAWYGHRDLGQTACPGKNLYPTVRRMRAASRREGWR